MKDVFKDPTEFANKVVAHLETIATCHYAIANSTENRKIFEEYICSICAKTRCTGKGRCRATDKTFAQLNLLTALVTFRDEGSRELGIDGFDRIVTIGQALKPFNPVLADYFNEDGIQELHAIICLYKEKDERLCQLINSNKLVIPKEYGVKVNKILKEEKISAI